MPGPSTIEWTDFSWNVATGCTKVSPGCGMPLPGAEGQRHGTCYAETFAERWRGIPGHAYEQGFDLRLWPNRLDWPLTVKKPRRIFVNSMSDLFHADIPSEYLDRVFDVMRRAHWHTFQVLTKRAERMDRMMNRRPYWGTLPNVWLGVSVESPAYYSRIRHLQNAPATLRFLSCEPLLEPVPDLPLSGIGWVIVGGESGPGARGMDPMWALDIVEQCRRANVPAFVKQLGSVWARAVRTTYRGTDSKGGRWEFWHPDLRIREYPA